MNDATTSTSENTNTTKRSIIAINNAPPIREEGEEVEVVAQFIVPQEDCCAWFLLLCCFLCQFIVDGCALTYGALLPDIIETLNIDTSFGALVNSVEIALYYLFSPVSSALINRFGFRITCMSGSMIACFGLLSSYFCNHLISLILFLGIFTGAGASLISMSSSLLVGFCFQKRRSLALAIASGGSSVGIMTMYPVNSALVKLSGWKSTILLHAGLHGLVYFLSLTFRPLLSLTLTQTESGSLTHTVAYLPTTFSRVEQSSKVTQATATEKMLGAYSNRNFPTASVFFKDEVASVNIPSTSVKSTTGLSRKTLQARGSASKAQLKLVRSMVSKIKTTSSKTTEITLEENEEKSKTYLGRLLNWQEDKELRPLYRDDVFYDGRVEDLPIYQKSVCMIKEEDRTGLEYSLAVTRAVRADDFKRNRGCCTVGMRRVLVSMIDPSLLKRKSFLLYGLSSFFASLGQLVPYVFIQDRNLQAGIDRVHCSFFVSVLSFSNLIGRLVFSSMADYIEPTNLLMMGLLVAGVATMCSDISYSVIYQYTYAAMFGGFVSVTGLRSTVLVKLYGLEHLTNATGIILMFLGIGNLISTPIAAMLKTKIGYKYAFYLAGGFITLSAIILFPVRTLCKSENSVKK